VKEADLQRFWSKVQITDSCWLWTKSKQRGGYGKFFVEGKEYGAHRVSWEIHNGPIPDGMHVLHDCPGGDNPACINPAHLWLGKWLENNHDTAVKGRRVEGDHLGEKSGNNKILADDVKVIRELRSSYGMTYQQIADLFGLHFTTIAYIIKRKLWPHVQ
jgi:HNH endonuclease